MERECWHRVLLWTLALCRLSETPSAGFKQARTTRHRSTSRDERTPEGSYTIDYRNPHSAYHLSLHISYPDAAAKAFAARSGRSPGGDIFIHGQPNELSLGRVPGDWTDGCIALSNQEIEALWQAVGDGTPIEIRP